jgi:uncharacterized oligopeptide transporter (OPT) family protein
VIFVAGLGVCIAVPLRRRAIEVDKLRFPSGTVAAETIRTLHSKSGEALRGLGVLALSAGASAVVTWWRDIGIPRLVDPVIPGRTTLPGSLGEFTCDKLRLGMAWSPLLLAVGAIIGLRAALSLALGAGLSWALGGPILAHLDVIDPEAKRAVISWTVWPAVGLMTAGGLVGLLFGVGVFRRALDMFKGGGGKPTQGAVPRTWWIGGLALCTAGASVAAWIAFRVPVWQSLVAIVLALPIAAVAVRAVGETDISPSNNLAKTAQFVFAGLAPGQTVTNVAAAGVASGCAIEASEVMTDLKAGHMLGNRPRDQFVAQLVGILVSAGAAVAAYSLLVAVIPLGSDDGLPAPTAVAWRTLADGLAGGKSGIPPHAASAAWIAAGVGALLGALGARLKKWPLPSPVAMGLGAIIPPCYSVTILAGALIGALLRTVAGNWWKKDMYLVTSGLIVGESLTGLLAAFLMLLGLA